MAEKNFFLTTAVQKVIVFASEAKQSHNSEHRITLLLRRPDIHYCNMKEESGLLAKTFFAILGQTLRNAVGKA